MSPADDFATHVLEIMRSEARSLSFEIMPEKAGWVLHVRAHVRPPQGSKQKGAVVTISGNVSRLFAEFESSRVPREEILRWFAAAAEKIWRAARTL
jgi:hypothetical protein